MVRLYVSEREVEYGSQASYILVRRLVYRRIFPSERSRCDDGGMRSKWFRNLRRIISSALKTRRIIV